MMDRYARRELTPEESRELAQGALDHPELFEDLTYTALASRGLSRKAIRGKSTWYTLAGLAAAAAIVISVYMAGPVPKSSMPGPGPALSFSGAPGQPLLLASDLRKAEPGAPVFRGGQPDSRAPRQVGSIVLIEDDLATIDLGSLDGLAKGSQVEAGSGARLPVMTVFRERARARIPAGQQVRVRDEVRVAPADHLTGLMEQVDALANRGESEAARAMARRAAQAVNLTPVERRRALERLATLEYQAGSQQEAERHYRSAVESLDRGEASVALNNLAVLQLLRGEHKQAEELLGRAVSASVKTDAVYGQSLNNLGVLAELRGDRQKAQALYVDALRALASGEDRRAVETNLARVRGVR
jgi:Flp pilus assembly protein TadD